MNKHLIKLTSLTFVDQWGNFIVREEYVGRIFSATEWLNKFIAERKENYQNLYSMSLSVAPQHSETLHPDYIPLVFEAVGEFYNLKPNQIFERTKKHDILHPRWFAMRICSDRGLTETMIGDASGFDHSTVNNAKVGVTRLLLNNIEKQDEYNRVCDFVLYTIHGRFKEDGSGQQK